MPDTDYLISCAVSSVGGLVVGLFAGATLDGRLNKVGRRIRSLFSSSTAIGLLVAAVVVGSMVMVFLQGQELDRQREYSIRVTECQSKANEAFREALTARSASTQQLRDAQIAGSAEQIRQNYSQDKLLGASLAEDSAAAAAAVDEYRARLKDNTEALRREIDALIKAQSAIVQNPYPPLKCDGGQ